LDKYQEPVDQGVAELDPVKRAETYSKLNQLVYEDAPKLFLATAPKNTTSRST
jgi:hypothetical protein